jgi:hypothetical protein
MNRQICQNSDDKLPQRLTAFPQLMTPVVLPDGNGGFTPCPELLTESEVIRFLRIPEISNSKDYHNVIEHLKKIRGLPRIHICHKVLYPKKAVLEWVEKETDVEK